MKYLPVFVIFFWLVAGLYVGIAGLTRAKHDEALLTIDQDKEKLKKDTLIIVYDSIEINNQYELKYHLENEGVEKTFPWTMQFSSFFILVITALSFGLLGGVISLIKEVVFTRTPPGELQFWSVPVLGLLTGFIVLGVSYLLPTVLVKNGGEIRPITLMFLCLFGGLFAKTLHKKLTTWFTKMFL